MSGASVLRQLWITPKMLTLGVLAISLVGVLTFATSREVSRTATPATVPPSARPTRPALSPAAEAYIQAIWPIHGEVQRSLMPASLRQVLYKTQALGPAELQMPIEQA